MKLACLDVETTGFPPNAAVIEFGCTVLNVEDDKIISAEPTWSMLVNPWRGNPDLVMSPDAQAVHGITKEMLADAPAVDIGVRKTFEAGDIFIAHNAAFEQHFFSGGGKPWICTLKVARRVWPTAPSHKLQELKATLPLRLKDEAFAAQAHRAGPDTYVTAALMHRFIVGEGITVQQMIEWTGSAAPLLEVMPIGKHKGDRFEDVPTTYLSWLIENVGDKDVVRTARHHVRLRKKEAAA